MFLKKLLVVKAIVQHVVHEVIETIQTIVNHQPHPPQEPDPVDPKPDTEGDVTSVPGGTAEAVVVYDQSGDGEPDTFVRLGTDEVEDPDSLDSYVAAADARLAQDGVQADLQKVIFEDADGRVTKVLYRTEDGGWSETDPNAAEPAESAAEDQTAEDLMEPMTDEELAELDTETDEDEEPVTEDA
jgi:hypothetical protein